MNFLRTILLFISLIAPLTTMADDQLQTFGPEGKKWTCTDGTFNLDLEFGIYIDNLGRGYSFYRHHVLKGFGVYGPRLSGESFVTIAKLSDYNTRGAGGESIKAYIPELKAELDLLDIDITYTHHLKLGVHGTLKLEGGKTYQLDCQ